MEAALRASLRRAGKGRPRCLRRLLRRCAQRGIPQGRRELRVSASAPGPVRVLTTPAEMCVWSDAARARGERIAFVPTMGYLHAGHIALLEEGRRRGDRLVLSIFVNPTQFGPNEDLSRYPRDLPGDLAKASAAGTDVAFVPEPAGMYPPGHQTTVQVHTLEQGLCGATRPGHFVGVATVVCKLFNIVRPHVTVFGEKDFQQLA